MENGMQKEVNMFPNYGFSLPYGLNPETQQQLSRIIYNRTELIVDVSSITMEQSVDAIPYVRLEGRLVDMPPMFWYNTSLKAKKVIYHNPATVVLWEDGTKTVVKCDNKDEYNEMLGLALCYMKKALGNSSRELNDALRSGAYSKEL